MNDGVSNVIDKTSDESGKTDPKDETKKTDKDARGREPRLGATWRP